MSWPKKLTMQDKVIFEYAIIRVVPRVEREEFFNVGVLLYSKQERFLRVQYQIDEKKLAAFSGELDASMLRAHLKAWEVVCAGGPDGGAIGELELPDRFRWLAATRSTIIQSSPTHPGLCADPAAKLEQLFRDFVL